MFLCDCWMSEEQTSSGDNLHQTTHLGSNEINNNKRKTNNAPEDSLTTLRVIDYSFVESSEVNSVNKEAEYEFPRMNVLVINCICTQHVTSRLYSASPLKSVWANTSSRTETQDDTSAVTVFVSRGDVTLTACPCGIVWHMDGRRLVLMRTCRCKSGHRWGCEEDQLCTYGPWWCLPVKTNIQPPVTCEETAGTSVW